MRVIPFLFSSILILIIQINASSQSFNIEWQGCYGGSDTEKSRDIISVEGGYLVAGSTKSDNGDISFNHGATDCWLFRINNIGELLWEKTYGGSLGDGIFRILPADNNNNYLLCEAVSSDGDIINDPYPGSADIWIVKVNSLGEIIWQKILGGTGDEQIWTGTPTNDGGLIALAWTTSNDGDVTNYYGLYDVWMVKLNSQGEKEWDFTIGTNGYDVGQAIIQTSDGGYLVGCASVIWDTGNITCEPFNSYSEAVLVKLDADRNIEWQQCYGGSGNDGVTALVEVSDGYVFGGYASSNDGDISGWHGEGDIWIVKVDYNGDIVWQKCLGGSKSEFISTLVLTEGEDILIPGYTKSTDGDVTGNHTISEYESDIWLVKLSSEGELLSEHCFGGIWDEEVNFGFLQKGEGNYVIAGQTDYGPSFDVACTPHGGLYDKDFWVFEVKDTLVGVQENISDKNELKVYPNPARDYVIFEIPLSLIKSTVIPTEGSLPVGKAGNPPNESTAGKSGDSSLHFGMTTTDGATVVIVDIFGREVARLPVKQEKTSPPSASLRRLRWDCREVIEGIYFYNIESENTIYKGKIIVQK